jgi:hypothetical protein
MNIGYAAKTFLDYSDDKHLWEVKAAGDQNGGSKYYQAKSVFEVNKIMDQTERMPLEYEYCPKALPANGSIQCLSAAMILKHQKL